MRRWFTHLHNMVSSTLNGARRVLSAFMSQKALFLNVISHTRQAHTPRRKICPVEHALAFPTPPCHHELETRVPISRVRQPGTKHPPCNDAAPCTPNIAKPNLLCAKRKLRSLSCSAQVVQRRLLCASFSPSMHCALCVLQSCNFGTGVAGAYIMRSLRAQKLPFQLKLREHASHFPTEVLRLKAPNPPARGQAGERVR